MGERHIRRVVKGGETLKADIAVVESKFDDVPETAQARVTRLERKSTRPEPVDPPEERFCKERGKPVLNDWRVYINAACVARLDHDAVFSGGIGKEIGGYMFGRPVKNAQGEVIGVWIQDMVLGPGFGTEGGYAFGIQEIQKIYKLKEKRPGLQGSVEVGWFHTHPNMGLFLSQPDLTTFRNFAVNRPEMVALVIAPNCTDTGKEGQTVGQFFVLDDTTEKGYRALGGFWEVGSAEQSLESNQGKGWQDATEGQTQRRVVRVAPRHIARVTSNSPSSPALERVQSSQQHGNSILAKLAQVLRKIRKGNS